MGGDLLMNHEAEDIYHGATAAVELNNILGLQRLQELHETSRSSSSHSSYTRSSSFSISSNTSGLYVGGKSEEWGGNGEGDE